MTGAEPWPERDAALGALEDVLRAAVSGTGGTAVVTAPVGCGKTALLHRFAERAAGGASAVVLDAVGSSAERALPLGVVSQLFGGPAAPADARAAVAALLAESASFAVPSGRDGGDLLHGAGARVIEGLWRTALELAATAPVLIVVDDVQDIDPLSRQCLLYFARRLRRARLALAVGEAAGVTPPWGRRPLSEELLRQSHCRQVALGPLSPDGVARYLAGRPETAAAAPAAATWHEVSGGNPELVRALVADQPAYAEAAAPRVASAYGHAVVGCLHRSGPDVLRAARGLAVLGDEATPGRLGALIGTGAGPAARAVETLTTAGLLRAGRFRHPTARAAVLADLAAVERADLHLHAAELLNDEGADVEAVAAKLTAAGRAPGPWGVAVLREGAARALASGRSTAAAERLALALRGKVGVRDRAAITARLATAEWRADPAAATRRLTELVVAARSGHVPAAESAMLVRALVWHGRLDEAREVFCGLTLPGPDAAEAGAAIELGFLRGWLRYSCPSLLEVSCGGGAEADPESGARTAIGPAAVTLAPHLQSAALLDRVLTHGGGEGVVAALEEIVRSSRLDDATLEPLATALTALLCADRAVLADRLCDVLLVQAETRRAPVWLAALAGLRARIAVRRGDLAAARRYARSALGALPEHSLGTTVGVPLAAWVTAATRMGDHDEAAALLGRPVPEAMFQTWPGLEYLHARGHLRLVRDRPHAALADFRSCGELMVRWGIDLPRLLPWRSAVALAHLRMGEPDAARAAVEEELELVGPGRSRVRGAGLRLLAAAAAPKERPSLLLEAVESLQASGDRLETAYALADLSRAYQTLGDTSRARRIARRAWPLARGCHAEPLCRELAPMRAGPAPAGPADADAACALSAAEHRVAALAAQGYTNREIARKLYVSASTVEQHLTRVYRKLDIRRRSHLPESLAVEVIDPA
ncbi:AAA family ATPase [Actinomadura sp. 9N215]|uniref:helix-turn-helix transcriptional regulator n=1 Tax=Actinomadura sp. 9N215 TaxID=3375150 RepID=UPI0037AAD6C9